MQSVRSLGSAPSTIGLLLLAVAVSGHGTASAAEVAACTAVDVEYAVSANLRIAGTPMGAGDGDHRIGPGKVVLRFRPASTLDSGSANSATMMVFELRRRFLVVAKVAFWTVRVMTDVETRATPDSRTLVAEGVLAQHSLRWTRVPGRFHDDGTLTCEGDLCGKFGAPPAGRSEQHLGPPTLSLGPFEFAADMKTFSMRSTLATQTNEPQQVSYISLAGRELRRRCVSEPST
jgi:hypothetical protein